ncbi:response regulator [Lentzea flaviverrucosa]|uniref:DNA-binding response regulator, NarL/FixJ family, contains REC and HTH domains n=1 Tax=Lentzea flaviverrucosa TaxID=200379 RepID=A0A1H9XWB8_9PSEU|nr:response regulator transcription factor [Lentzea flaviverrucosa]RDI34347.1 LuxR family two component transcriptional regulator [Lentzea flaviverrucosa]SES50482.1 DNA-binding response regulator, NarL/FixJ family, contains REC and HTH domains [Lentzea flaviverrucosa]
MVSRVFLVDDHEIVRVGIRELLSASPDLEVVGEASSVTEALTMVPATNPDVAVLDVRLPDGNGIELCRELMSRLPDLKCLMLTSFTDDEALFDAIMAGASGFVLKRILGTDLTTAVKTVAAGQSLLDARSTAALLNRIRREREQGDPVRALTEQERTVFDYIGDGLTNRQIAEKMFLAEKTVKNYVSHLLAKLGLERRTQAAVLASQLRKPTHDNETG